ncbi:MAG: glycosyltransferase family 9 protein [Planctomycetes bacterium]|nr:glycosyltransferase family 9 protein [Planctomycetota bacterium]
MSQAGRAVFEQTKRGQLAVNCRHFRGDRPCSAGHQGYCPTECADFAEMGKRVLVIKMAALGDVIRTAAILPALRRQLGVCHVTWVSRPEGVRMLANHPLIERLLPFDAESTEHLRRETFDLCLSLDKEPGPAGLAMSVNAHERRGIGLTQFGTPYPLNRECDEYFELGLNDEFKFRGNTRSYPELICRAVGLDYRGERYALHPNSAAQRAAELALQRAGLHGNRPWIGFNTGAGGVYANKTWPPARFLQLARLLKQRKDVQIALLGGPRERELNKQLAACCPGLIDLGCEHEEATFAAIVARCAVLLTGDTMALHVAVAMNVPVVALFGPTCAQEIDLFGRGEKLVTPLPCGPCYRRSCDKSPTCMDAIDFDQVLRAIESCLPASSRAVRALPVLEAVS